MNKYFMAGVAAGLLLAGAWAAADDSADDAEVPGVVQNIDETSDLINDLAGRAEAPAPRSAQAAPAAATDLPALPSAPSASAPAVTAAAADGASVPAVAAVLPLAEVKKVVCIGDCVTRGLWWNEDVGHGTCWVDQFAARENGVEVVNAGRDAMETKHYWYVKELMKENPDAGAVVIYLGTNDLRGVKDIDTDVPVRVAGRVGYMIDLIREKAPRARILVVAPQQIAVARLNEEWKKENFGDHTATMIELMSLGLQRVAQDKGVQFLSLCDQLSSDLLPDGVHPGMAGHARIAQLIHGAINNPPVPEEKKTRPVYAEVKKPVPPAEGRPYFNMSGTDAVVAGIKGDLMALKGPEQPSSSVAGAKTVERNSSSPAVKAAALIGKDAAGRSGYVSGFVSSRDRDGLVSGEACRFGIVTGEAITQALNAELDRQADAGMQTVYAHLDELTGDGNTVNITTEVPSAPGTESFITAIRLPDERDYGVIGGVVDWNGLEAPQVYNNVKLPAEEQMLPEAGKDRATGGEEAIALAHAESSRLKEMTRIEDLRDALDLPEAPKDRPGELLLPGGSLVPGIPAVSAFSSLAGADADATEPKTDLAPLPVPGYAVFVHTQPERLGKK